MRLAETRFGRREVAWFYRLFGAALVANVVAEIASGVWSVHAGRLYPWRHLPIVPLYGTGWLAIEWIAVASSGVSLALGWRRAIAVRVAAIAVLSSVLQRYSNHGALLFIVALFTSIDPPDPDAPDFEAREWPNLALVRAELAVVYFFSAANKIVQPFGPSLEHLFGLAPATASALAWIVILTEVALPIVLVVRPRVGIACVATVHAAFAAWMPGLASFGLAMLAMAILYDGARRGRARALR